MKRIAWLASALTIIAAISAVVFLFRNETRVLTFDGLGPVRLGMTVAEAEAALGAKLTPMNPANGMDSVDCWITRRVDKTDQGVAYMIWDGKSVRIDILRFHREGKPDLIPSVVTQKGVGFTTSVENIKRAYGADLVIDFHAYGDYGDYSALHMTVLSPDKKYGQFFQTWNNQLKSFGNGIAEALHLQEGCS